MELGMILAISTAGSLGISMSMFIILYALACLLDP